MTHDKCCSLLLSYTVPVAVLQQKSFKLPAVTPTQSQSVRYERRHAVQGGVRTPWCTGPTAVWGWGPLALKTMTSWQRALATGYFLLGRGPRASSLLPCMEPLPQVSERCEVYSLLLSTMQLSIHSCDLHMLPYNAHCIRVWHLAQSEIQEVPFCIMLILMVGFTSMACHQTVVLLPIGLAAWTKLTSCLETHKARMRW